MQDNPKARLPLWVGPVLSVVTGLAGLAFMFGWFPYGAGWGDQAASVISNLFWMWEHAAEWEHCALVPLISLAIIWMDREKLAGIPWEGSPSGLGLLLAGVFLFWVGYLIDIVVFSFLVFHFMIGAGMVWLFGWSIMRAVMFPYVFLFFAWPMPFLEAAIAFPLRNVMAALSHGFLNFIGLDALRVGTSIVSAPNPALGLPQGARFALDVADPCSGIRSLFALTMVAALFAHFGTSPQETWVGLRRRAEAARGWMKAALEIGLLLVTHWRGWLVFLSAAPFAVLGNFCRILMLTFGTLLLGNEVAIGDLENPSTFHMFSGFLVFGVALGGMFLWGWFLESGWRICRDAWLRNGAKAETAANKGPEEF